MTQANPANTTTLRPGARPAAPSPQTRSTVPGGIPSGTPGLSQAEWLNKNGPDWYRKRATVRDLTSSIRGTHAHLITRLAASPPNMIGASLQADEHDLQLRADHLRIVLRATADYVGAFMRDTADFSHAVQVERKYLDGIFDDVIGDLCGAIENAADRVREERAEREG